MPLDNVIRLQDARSSVWDDVLSCLRDLLPANGFGMWFGNRNLTLDSIEDGRARLVASNELVASWVDGHFKEALLSAFRQVSDVVDYTISVSPDSLASQVQEFSSAAVAPVLSTRAEKEQERAKRKEALLASFYPDYRFDTFVEGESNRIALAMCRSVAENPQECSMNPFFLFGGPGVGKTHLLQSIGRYALTYETAPTVVYRTAEQFLKDFMKTQNPDLSRQERAEASAELRRTYEDSQLLLMDDIQILAGIGHGATEKALFQVLQARVNSKRVTVFSADRRPSEIPSLFEGFSRFDGNSIAVSVPDLITRVNILRRKAAALQIPAEEREKIFQWVARHQQGNVREIEGVVAKLFAYHDLLGISLTLDLFKELCGSCDTTLPTASGKKAAITISSIKEVVAAAHGISVESLTANTRVRSVSEPRKIAMYFCRQLTKESLLNIGFQFGGRNYATVIASIKAVEREMRRNPDYAQSIEKIRQSFSL
ncbi:DnaA/Hda family protein [Fibrobacter intestinalis]|uniref:DnaA ATPase domain-containing protein n=1 Tax=Fibrobacter intestinalis TaxID=28122 RepID=UPI0023F3EEF3|nr:DnaA/Hda family protein [Fibrobacter intestinalis]MDD7298990.1 DnaA/Hda family protein [Fibrobacter intestinalis]